MYICLTAFLHERILSRYDDVISEFIWFRTDNRKKFFVRDVEGNKTFVSGRCIWFDDHLAHNIEVIDEPCFSVRVDGRFSQKFREHICEVGYFRKEEYSDVLLVQPSARTTFARPA